MTESIFPWVVLAMATAVAYVAIARYFNMKKYSIDEAIKAARAAPHKPAEEVREIEDSADSKTLREIAGRLVQIHLALDEQKDATIALLRSQNAFVKTLKDLTGIETQGDKQPGDDEDILADAKRYEMTYGISREEALKRARKTAVYRQDNPMGDRV